MHRRCLKYYIVLETQVILTEIAFGLASVCVKSGNYMRLRTNIYFQRGKEQHE